MQRGNHLAWRRLAALVGGLALGALAMLLGAAAAVVGFLATAAFSSRVPLLLAAGLVACFSTAAALGWLAGRRLVRARRRAVGLGLGLGTTALVALASTVTILRPLVPPSEILPVAATPSTRFWNLPTGSRIAYLELPALSGSGNPPVLFLHGGPGAGVVSTPALAEALRFLTEIGHRVYLYDQIGGGRSGRLADARQYTVERHVRDLEAIRQRLGVDSMILVGESWGAELASHYLAAHPRRVDKCVLVSPGPLPGKREERCDLRGRASAEKRAAWDRLVSRALPRVLTAGLLLEVNPAAAGAFLPDAEADAFARRAFQPLLEKMVCDPENLPESAHFDFGLWGNLKTDEDKDNQLAPIDDRLRRFEGQVLILRGECDYCVPEVAKQYQTVFPNATLVSIEGAGHIIWLDKPAQFADALRCFLLGLDRCKAAM